MKSMIKAILLAGLLLMLVSFSASAAGVHDESVGTLREYFDLLVSGNADVAVDLWWPPARERGERFGIEYNDIFLKIDCVSPAIRDFKRLRPYLISPVSRLVELDDDYTRVEFAPLVDGVRVEHDYYIHHDGEYFWLVYPQDYYGRTWPVIESEFLRLHVDPGATTPSPLALESADQFVRDAGKKLGLSKKQLKEIAEKKIEYFYCAKDSTVLEITGHLVKGTMDLASNDIISAFFPHYHEMTHLLVNIKLGTIPIYTQPIIREGLAVAVGGRWGKTPEALMQLGEFLYREKLVEIDSLLTMKQFQNSATENIAYPVSGLFNLFLLDALGTDSYLQLYRDLSGQFDNTYAMTPDQVKSQLARAVKAESWSDLIGKFDGFLKTSESVQMTMLPGCDGSGKSVLESPKIRAFRDGDWIGFQFNYGSSSPSSGNMLLGKSDVLAESGSSMYLEQYPDATDYEGHRWGVRFDQNEAGLYDYATNLLVAKYIWGLNPSEEYHNQQQNVIAFRIKSELIDLEKLEVEEIKLLDN